MPTPTVRPKHPQGLVDLNGNVYFLEQSWNPNVNAVGVMSESNTTTSGITEYRDTVVPPGYASGLRHMVTGQDGNLYITWTGDGTEVQNPLHYFNPTSHAFTTVPAPGGLPYDPDSIQRSNVAGSTSLVFNDLLALAVGIHDTVTHDTTLIPAYTSVTPPLNYPADALQTTPNDFWFTAGSGFGIDGKTFTTKPLIGHIARAAGWTIFPQLTGTLPINGTGDPNAFLFAVIEQAGGTDTFTITSSASAICTVAAIPNFPGDYKVVGVAPGSCTVTVKDHTQRAASLTFQISTQTATINSKARRQQ